MRVLLLTFIVLINLPYKCNKPNKNIYPVFGIDVSHHQGRMNWDKLKAANVSFVFMKATEGGDFKDSMFMFNWAMAKTLKIKRGAYHYFTFCTNGKDQARNFLETAKFEIGDLPPVLDIEFGGNCKRNTFKREQLLSEIQIFMEEMERVYCAKPVIYTTNEFYKDYLVGSFTENPIWIRDVLSKPQLPDNRNWAFWQYRIDALEGIKGEVDMNVFNGDEADFAQFALDTCHQTPAPVQQIISMP